MNARCVSLECGGLPPLSKATEPESGSKLPHSKTGGRADVVVVVARIAHAG
jgi:hypothetical protein